MGVRLGLLSTARINDAILTAAAASEDVEVVAVASREAERARTYARDKRIATAHGSDEALLADPDVDAVSISLPNGLHAEWAVRALEAGKHVLVEKPFSRRAAEVEHAFDVAEREGLILTEGFMWRHHPQARKLVELLPEIGEVRLVRAVFSFDLGRPGDPRWEPALDGGALMDVGCYCINAARLICGEPDEARGADAVAPDVHERPAVERGLPARVARLAEVERERRAHEAHLPDLGQQVDERAHLRVVAPHEPLGEDEPLPLGDVERVLDLRGAARERLLDEHVLARLERAHRPLGVQRVGERDVHRVDVGVGEQRLVRAVRRPDLAGARVRPRALVLAAGHRDDLHRVRGPRGGEDRVVDPRGRQQAELQPHEPSPIGR